MKPDCVQGASNLLIMASRGNVWFRTGYAIFVALFVAVLGTLQHQTQLAAGAPLGLIFSLSLVFMGAAFIRDRNRSKVPVLAFAVSLAVLIFFFGQAFSQDVLIPANDLGLYWSYGAIGIAMLVALWPKLNK